MSPCSGEILGAAFCTHLGFFFPYQLFDAHYSQRIPVTYLEGRRQSMIILSPWPRAFSVGTEARQPYSKLQAYPRRESRHCYPIFKIMWCLSLFQAGFECVFSVPQLCELPASILLRWWTQAALSLRMSQETLVGFFLSDRASIFVNEEQGSKC
jgi:hypothetical protein